eukprot:scaffold2738_cov119-Cylindrotheca_fusiformis.AAC.11
MLLENCLVSIRSNYAIEKELMAGWWEGDFKQMLHTFLSTFTTISRNKPDVLKTGFSDVLIGFQGKSKELYSFNSTSSQKCRRVFLGFF